MFWLNLTILFPQDLKTILERLTAWLTWLTWVAMATKNRSFQRVQKGLVKKEEIQNQYIWSLFNDHFLHYGVGPIKSNFYHELLAELSCDKSEATKIGLQWCLIPFNTRAEVESPKVRIWWWAHFEKNGFKVWALTFGGSCLPKQMHILRFCKGEKSAVALLPLLPG